MFVRKRRQNVRVRRTSASGESDEDCSDSKPQHLPVKGASGLSFQNEEEDEVVFKVKKPSETLKFKKRAEKERKRREKESKPPLQDEGLSVTCKKLISPSISDDEPETIPTTIESKFGVARGLEHGYIPNAAAIHAARKQRQLARDEGCIEAPIVSRDPVFSKQDDSSDEDERLVMIGKRNNALESRLSMQEALEQEDSNSDTELIRWEKEQFKKAVGSRNFVIEEPVAAAIISTANVESTEIPPELDPASVERKCDELRSILQNLQFEYENNTRASDQRLDGLVKCKTSLRKAQERVPVLEKRYAFVQNIQSFFRDLTDCWNEKSSAIIDLERCVYDTYSNAAARLSTRLTNLVKAEAAEHRVNVLMVCDEKSVYEKDTNFDVDQLNIEYEVPEEELNTLMQESAERALLEARALHLFDDVKTEFVDLRKLIARFTEWNSIYPSSYQAAYASLCLPRLVAPLVRIQMLLWNPLDKSYRAFEDFPWFEILCGFGDIDVEGNPDLELVPKVVEMVVMKKLTFFASKVYDISSYEHTYTLFNLIAEMFDIYPSLSPDSRYCQDFIIGLLSRMNESAADHCFIPIYTSQLMELHPPMKSFLYRQYKRVFTIFSNMVYWAPLINPESLQTVAVDTVLNRHLLQSLTAMNVSNTLFRLLDDICIKIPAKWWFGDLDGNKTIPCLEPLARFISQTASTVYRVSLGNTVLAETQELNNFDRAELTADTKKLLLLLVDIHAYDQALLFIENQGLMQWRPLIPNQ